MPATKVQVAGIGTMLGLQVALVRKAVTAWGSELSPEKLAQFLDKTKEVKFPRGLKVRFGHHVDDVGNVEPNIWNSYGSFDAARHKRIATAQAFALAPLLENPGDRLQIPPAYVRPGEMPEPATRSYYFHELLKELA